MTLTKRGLKSLLVEAEGGGSEEEEEELQGVTRKKRTATDLLVLTRLFGT